MITNVKFLYKGISGFKSLHRWSKTSAQISPEAKKRLKWFDYYRKCNNVCQTCRYFGISRKTFYLWKKRYDPRNLLSLEAFSSAPKNVRQRELSFEQEQRIIKLRKQYLRYGKQKLAYIYQREYQQKISSWKIQKVIEKHQLYYHPIKCARIARKRLVALKKKRITELKKKNISGFLICLDAIVIHWNGLRRYIFTAIDYYSKIAYARMYQSESSVSSSDFLLRLNYLLEGKISNLGHDNGSSFYKHFMKACQDLGLNQYWSRPRTPKDNAVCERFNQTLKTEFINLGNFTPDMREFNQGLTNWLIEYNFKRPHQSLGYIPPINFETKYLKVLPRYPSSTIAFNKIEKMVK